MESKKFNWNSTDAKALGIVFSTSKHDIFKLNLDPKIKDFENCLKSWNHRKLSLLGKITVLKTFALPKLIYPLTVLPSPPDETIKHINESMFKFIWNNKPSKIKKRTLIQTIDIG